MTAAPTARGCACSSTRGAFWGDAFAGGCLRRPCTGAATAPAMAGRLARRGGGVDGGVPLLLRLAVFPLHGARLLQRSVLDHPAHAHRHPVPVLRRPGSGRGACPRAGLAALLETLGPGGGLRRAGQFGVVVGLWPALHQFRRLALSGLDAAAVAWRFAFLARFEPGQGALAARRRGPAVPCRAAVLQSSLLRHPLDELDRADDPPARHRRPCAAAALARCHAARAGAGFGLVDTVGRVAHGGLEPRAAPPQPARRTWALELECLHAASTRVLRPAHGLGVVVAALTSKGRGYWAARRELENPGPH